MKKERWWKNLLKSEELRLYVFLRNENYTFFIKNNFTKIFIKINTKIRYGLRTIIELGLHDNQTGLFQKDIAMNQQLSEKYLDPIIAALKTSGLITNLGGKKRLYS
jgi:hypothetical protein